MLRRLWLFYLPLSTGTHWIVLELSGWMDRGWSLIIYEVSTNPWGGRGIRRLGKQSINTQELSSLGAEPGDQSSGGDDPPCAGGFAPGAEERARDRDKWKASNLQVSPISARLSYRQQAKPGTACPAEMPVQQLSGFE